jgi:hypothetical protein
LHRSGIAGHPEENANLGMKKDAKKTKSSLHQMRRCRESDILEMFFGILLAGLGIILVE